MPEERRKILDLLAEGKISVEQAEALLKALTAAGGTAPVPPGPPAAPAAVRIGPGVRGLQIQVVNDEAGKVVNVTVPLGLIRFAGKLVPEHARNSVRENGIDLDELVRSLENPELLVPGTSLVELTADSKNGGTDTIVIRAV